MKILNNKLNINLNINLNSHIHRHFNFNRNFNRKNIYKISLLNIAILLSFFPNLKAVSENSSENKFINQSTLNSPSSPQQKICSSQSSEPRRTFETAKYSIYICAGDVDNSRAYYIAVSKMGAAKINLPIAKKSGETYIATNGLLMYSVTPYELLITKKRRIIHKEKVNSAIQDDGKSIATGCPNGQHIFTSAETRNYIIYICGEKIPTSYVSLAKDGNDSITLPLQSDNNPKESQYTAIDGNTHYFLSRNALRVSTQGLTVIKERVLHWD